LNKKRFFIDTSLEINQLLEKAGLLREETEEIKLGNWEMKLKHKRQAEVKELRQGILIISVKEKSSKWQYYYSSLLA
jgi:hypothetical protein